MFHVGIDVSLSKAGFVILTEQGVIHTMDAFHAQQDIKFDRVMAQTDVMIARLLELKRENVGFVAVEEPAWGAVRFVSYDIGMSYGILMEHLIRNKFNYIIVNPSKVKSFVSEKRFKGKFPVKQWCEQHGVKFPDGQVRQEFIFDMADAYILAKISQLFSEARLDIKKQFSMPKHQWRIFCGQDSKGREVGLLDRPDLYRIFP